MTGVYYAIAGAGMLPSVFPSAEFANDAKRRFKPSCGVVCYALVEYNMSSSCAIVQ